MISAYQCTDSLQFGQTYYVMICPALNSPLYMLSKFDFLGFLGYVEKYQITMIGAVPPIMIALAKHPAVAKFNLSSVRSMGSGAAPLSAEIAHEVEEKFKTQQKADIKVRQGWGMTE